MDSITTAEKNNSKRFFAAYLLPLIFAFIYILLAASSIYGKSMTYDEKYHLIRGVMLLETGDLRLNTHHPYFANALNALPIYLTEDMVLPGEDSENWKSANKDLLTDEVVELNGGEISFSQKYIFKARAVSIGIFASFIIFFYTFVRRAWGVTEASIATTFMAFSPTFLAHGALATTDMFAAVTIFTSTAILWRYTKLPREEIQKRNYYLAFFLLLGFLAIMSKYSVIPIVLLWLGWLWVHELIMIRGDFKLYIRTQNRLVVFLHGVIKASLVTALVILTWGLMLSATYKFEVKSMKDILYTENAQNLDAAYDINLNETRYSEQAKYIFEHVKFPFPYYVRGVIENVVFHNIKGHETYFLGRYNDIPDTYHLVAFALKEPVVTVISSATAVIMLSYYGFAYFYNRRNRSSDNLKRIPIHTTVPALFILVAAILFISISLSNIKLGIRHIAPVLPFLFMINGAMLAVWWRRVTTARIAISAALIILAVDVFLSWPDYISYFSMGIGDHRNGYQYLRDSNLDWRQNEYMVRDYIVSHPQLDIKYSSEKIVPGNYYVISLSDLFGDPEYSSENSKAMHALYEARQLRLQDWISNTHWVVYVEEKAVSN